MAAADITLNADIATIECDATVHKITLEGMSCNLVNVGAQSVFIRTKAGAMLRTGLQADGEIKLDPNDSVPIPADASYLWHQCAIGESTKLWYIPSAG